MANCNGMKQMVNCRTVLKTNLSLFLILLCQMLIHSNSFSLDQNYVFDSNATGTWQPNYTSAQPELGIGPAQYYLCGFGFREMKFNVNVCNCNCRNVVFQQVPQWKCSYCNNQFWTQANAFKGIFCSYSDWNLKIQKVTETGNINSGNWRQFRCPKDRYASRVAVRNTGNEQGLTIGLNGMLMECSSRNLASSSIIKDDYDYPLSQRSSNQQGNFVSSYKLKYLKNDKLLGIEFGFEGLLQAKNITINEIMEYRWKFYNMNSYLGIVIFNPDKTISQYNNPNQRFWSFDGIYLYVYNANKQLTCKYIDMWRDQYGKWHLRGYFSGPPNTWEHILVQEVHM